MFPVIFGHNITDDDHNPNYANKIRSIKKEDFIEDYKVFIEKIKENFSEYLGVDEKIDKCIKDL